MSMPTPRSPGDDVATDDQLAVERDAFLAAFSAMYDRLRAGSRAHLAHAAEMMVYELGGVLWVQLPYRAIKRTLPEAGYVSETPPSVRLG